MHPLEKNKKEVHIGLLCASGYTITEIVWLLANHPYVSIMLGTIDRKAGQFTGSVFPHLIMQDLQTMVSVKDADFSNVGAVSCCLPHETTQEIIKGLFRHLEIVDLSADFQLRNIAEYGEWYGQPHSASDLQKEVFYGLIKILREEVKSVRLVANLCCYLTSIQLPLVTMIKVILIEHRNIVTDSKSNVSEAEHGAKEANLYSEIAEGINSYRVTKHRHAPEIEQGLYVGIAAVGIFIIWYTHGSSLGIDLSGNDHTLLTCPPAFPSSIMEFIILLTVKVMSTGGCKIVWVVYAGLMIEKKSGSFALSAGKWEWASFTTLERIKEVSTDVKKLSSAYLFCLALWQFFMHYNKGFLLSILEGIVGEDKVVTNISCSLLHTKVNLVNETKLGNELKSWLASAAQKIVEVNVLAKALVGQKAAAVAVQKVVAALRGSNHQCTTNISARVAKKLGITCADFFHTNAHIMKTLVDDSSIGALRKLAGLLVLGMETSQVLKFQSLRTRIVCVRGILMQA